MNIKIKDLLPIASIVILKDGEQPLMIYGIMQLDGKKGLFSKQKEYDYVSVPYLQGNLGAGMTFLFNHEDIKEIIFRGYEDEERDKFLNELSNRYEKENEK